ncbi:MAG: PIG-L family deacetylase [Nitrospinota bacterium]
MNREAGKPFTLFLVHAHPDDECSSTGGLLLRSAAEGRRTVLLTCTNGEWGEVKDPRLGLRPRERPGDRRRLGEVRLEELRRAARILGVAHLHPLGYHDSGMAGWEGNRDPQAFVNAPLEEPAGRIAALIREHRPEVLITYDAKGGYGHPDHIMAHRAATAALAEAERPAPGQEPWRVPKVYHTAFSRRRILRTWRLMRLLGQRTPLDDPDFREDRYGTAEEEITTRVDVRPYLSGKWRALRAHRSQIGGSFFWRFMRLTARWNFPEECFVRVRGGAPPGGVERSVFEGL